MIKNQAAQVIGSQMVDATSGGAYVGTVTVYVDVDATGQAIGQTSGGICQAAGNGYYTYQPVASETNGNLLAFTFTGAGAIPVTVQIATVTPSQQSALTTATGGLSTPVATIIADAFREIAVFAATAAVPPDDFAFGLGKLNRLFDNMTDDRRLTFSQTFTAYPLTPNHQPHTIGPNLADFSVPSRPNRFMAAQLVLTDSSPNLYLPLNLRDHLWWSQVPVRGIATSIPTDLYYEPDWPNGNIFLYPVPTVAYQIELVQRVSFGQVAATDIFWLPPGYRDYVTLQLAKSLAPAYPGAIVSPDLKFNVAEAESRLINMNVRPPRLATQQAGMPGTPVGGDFNYKDRSFR